MPADPDGTATDQRLLVALGRRTWGFEPLTPNKLRVDRSHFSQESR